MTDTTMTLVELPEEIHIANVSAVRDDLDQHLNGSLTQVDIAAASVNRVDTAGLQLLRAFSGAAEEAGATVRWLDPSAQLLELPRAKALGRLLLTCAPDNLGSNKTILANGGALERRAYLSERGRWTNYYWITLTRGGG